MQWYEIVYITREGKEQAVRVSQNWIEETKYALKSGDNEVVSVNETTP